MRATATRITTDLNLSESSTSRRTIESLAGACQPHRLADQVTHREAATPLIGLLRGVPRPRAIVGGERAPIVTAPHRSLGLIGSGSSAAGPSRACRAPRPR